MENKPEISAKLPKSLANEIVSGVRKVIATKIVADAPEFVPIYAHENDACCDLRANIPEGEISIGSGEIAKIDTGIKIQIPVGFEVQIRCRSGWACNGLMMANGIGTIDCGYTGKVTAIVVNASNKIIIIKHLDKIAQMTIKPVWYFDFDVVKELESTQRGESGFGSTGF